MQDLQLLSVVEPLHLLFEVGKPTSNIQVSESSSTDRSNHWLIFQRLHHEAGWERFWHFKYAQDIVFVLV